MDDLFTFQCQNCNSKLSVSVNTYILKCEKCSLTYLISNEGGFPVLKLVTTKLNGDNVDVNSTKSSWNYLYTLTENDNEVNRVIFSPNGQIIASCGMYDPFISIWAVKDGELLNRIPAFFGSINDISFSQNGDVVAAACEDKTVKLFSVKSGKLLETLSGHTDEVWRVVYSRDGRYLASVSNDCTIRLWGAHSSQLKNVYSFEKRPGHIAFFPNEYLFNVSLISIVFKNYVNQLNFFNFEGGNEPELIEGIIDHEVFDISLSSDSNLVACASYNSIYLWYLPKKQFIGKIITNHSRFIWTVAFDPDGWELAFGNDDGTVQFYDFVSQNVTHVLKGHTKRVYSVSFSNDGQFLASGSLDRTIRVWRRTNS
jgi:WD40 repeat protein